MRNPWFPLVVALLPWSGSASAQHMHAAAPPRCGDTTLACASVATPAFGPDGSLWLAWVAGGKVMVAHSTDLGRSFAPSVAVNPEPAKLDTGPDSRPKIVVDPQNRVHVAYALFQDERYNGRVFFSRSVDGGTSFAAPQPITDDATSQRFETLALDPSGDVFAAWLDKRNAAAARKEGKFYPGAALTFAWSNEEGTHFSAARIARDETCECCRLAVAFAGPHRPVVAFRNIFDGHTRDHAVTTFADADTPGPLYRVSVDNWKTDVCPHQGPSLAIDADGTYHLSWFTDGTARKGVFYARSLDGGMNFTAPMPLGGDGRHAARPYVLAVGTQVWLAWKEFDGEGTTIKLMTSSDDGASWSPAVTIASTADASDHPLLIGDGRQAYLSWLTNAEGYRLLSLTAGR